MRNRGPVRSGGEPPSRRGGILACGGRHVPGIRRGPDPPEREAIGVPAGADRRIAAETAAGVASTRKFDEPELLVSNAESIEIERAYESRATRTVRWIAVVADPLRVVQDGEKSHNRRVALGSPLREVKADRRDVAPVILSVNRVERGR